MYEKALSWCLFLSCFYCAWQFQHPQYFYCLPQQEAVLQREKEMEGVGGKGQIERLLYLVPN